MTLDTLRARLRRLREVLLRPLWVEEETLTARRRCHFIVAFPFVAIAGAAYGWLVAPDLGVSELPALLLGTVAFTVFLHVQLVLEPVLTHFFRRRNEGAAPLVPFLWDVGLGGILAYMITERLGAPVMPSVTAATAAGALYAVVTGYLFCGGGVTDLVETVFAARGGSTPHRKQHSRAAALATRGDFTAAVMEYRMAIEADPTDPVPYFRLARVLSAGQGRHEEALAVLREGLQRARFSTPSEEAFLVREIFELCERKLDDPTRAAPSLALLLERRPDGEAAVWARRQLTELKARIARGHETPPGPTD